ncbi:NAD(P)/FAD-dependent oxidoreductase [Streptacidiphilus sp. 4-A2]|nr:NAD(P)/FAD-dependent oxidoreductase [Streptacidiphilus sp. 4-A2]
MPQSLVPDTDLVVIGGGPAGCAAVVMAASVGMSSVLVEPKTPGHTLHRIPVLDNVLGFTSGPAYAEALAAGVHHAGAHHAAGCEVLLGERADRLAAADDHVTVHLAVSGRTVTGRFVVVATGVRDARMSEAGWITGGDAHWSPLWDADAEALIGRSVLVLGADRPLGTLLRSRPDLPLRLVVPYPEADDYKADEVRGDPRVTLVPVRSLALSAQADGRVLAEATAPAGRTDRWRLTADEVLLNLGRRPAELPGLYADPGDGYCPPDRQHPRVLTAGDLRSARAQRIMTATGSGSEAALRAYYAARLDDWSPHGSDQR